MNYRAVLRYMGQVLAIEGLFMLPALLLISGILLVAANRRESI